MDCSPETNYEAPQTQEGTPREEVPGAGEAAAEAAEEETDTELAEGKGPEDWHHRLSLETTMA
jgi:hypothetical protein